MSKHSYTDSWNEDSQWLLHETRLLPWLWSLVLHLMGTGSQLQKIGDFALHFYGMLRYALEVRARRVLVFALANHIPVLDREQSPQANLVVNWRWSSKANKACSATTVQRNKNIWQDCSFTLRIFDLTKQSYHLWRTINSACLDFWLFAGFFIEFLPKFILDDVFTPFLFIDCRVASKEALR